MSIRVYSGGLLMTQLEACPTRYRLSAVGPTGRESHDVLQLQSEALRETDNDATFTGIRSIRFANTPALGRTPRGEDPLARQGLR